MKIHLLKVLDSLRTSLWFIPTLMSLAAAVLSYVLPALDRQHLHHPEQWQWLQVFLYAGQPGGARTVLGAIAGSMITVAGTVFSVTIVALSLATNQFGPRLLRNFLSDRGNQSVLGTFLATFLYCILVMREVRGGDEGASFVPAISVSVAVALGVASLGVLIYFIHHITQSMQAGHLVNTVEAELSAQIERMFPEESTAEHTESSAPNAEALVEDEPGFSSIRATNSGYVQAVDIDGLVALGTKLDAVLYVRSSPGDFVMPGQSLVSLLDAQSLSPKPTPASGELIEKNFSLGIHRTPHQNIAFGIDQIVEVAVRALSPGTNDPFTAIACVDRLGATLARLAPRRFPPAESRDKAGHLRVILPGPDFSQLVDIAFNQIRQNARTVAPVIIRLVDVIAKVARLTSAPQRKAALRRQLEAIAEQAEALSATIDREDLRRHVTRALRFV